MATRDAASYSHELQRHLIFEWLVGDKCCDPYASASSHGDFGTDGLSGAASPDVVAHCCGDKDFNPFRGFHKMTIGEVSVARRRAMTPVPEQAETCPTLQGKRVSPHTLRHYILYFFMSSDALKSLDRLAKRVNSLDIVLWLPLQDSTRDMENQDASGLMVRIASKTATGTQVFDA